MVLVFLAMTSMMAETGIYLYGILRVRALFKKSYFSIDMYQDYYSALELVFGLKLRSSMGRAGPSVCLENPSDVFVC